MKLKMLVFYTLVNMNTEIENILQAASMFY